MKVILVCGKRGAGKDTFVHDRGLFKLLYRNLKSEPIPKILPKDRNVIKFAAPLRGLLGNHVNFNDDVIEISPQPLYDLVKTQIHIPKISNKIIYDDNQEIQNEKMPLGDYDDIKECKEIIPHWGSIRNFFISVASTARQIDPDFFVKSVYNELHEKYLEETTFWCTDWRYPNERDFLLSKGVEVITVRIIRNDGKHDPIDHHSETSLDTCDVDYIYESIVN
jgi:hypothetical protein